MSGQDTTWLPNLVGGVSIWKLAPDLNEEKFFGGRLLMPETEGSESLPSTVRWNLAGLLPLSEARQKHGPEVATAIEEFKACLDRAAKAFAQEDSGYHRYREALTVPSIEADGVENYFYSPTDRRLYVINWGATPRTLAGQKEFLFGYAEFGKVFGAVAAAAVVSGAVAKKGASNANKQAEDEPKKDEPKKDDEKADEKKGRPFWVWLLFGLGFLLLLLALLALLKTCNDAKLNANADAMTDAMTEGGAEAGSEAGADGSTDANVDAANEAGTDAGQDAGDGGKDGGQDAMADAGDAGDAGKDGGKDAGPDGGKKPKGKTGFDNDASFKGGKVTVTGGGGGGGGGPVKITISPAPGGGSQSGPHRRHDHPQAVAWRIMHGDERVARTEEAGKRFDVYLNKGESFDGVEVEYQDADGEWHAH